MSDSRLGCMRRQPESLGKDGRDSNSSRWSITTSPQSIVICAKFVAEQPLTAPAPARLLSGTRVQHGEEHLLASRHPPLEPGRASCFRYPLLAALVCWRRPLLATERPPWLAPWRLLHSCRAQARPRRTGGSRRWSHPPGPKA